MILYRSEVSAKRSELLELSRTQVVRARDLEERRLPRRLLRELVETGKLLRTGRGLYVSADLDLSQNYSLAEASKRWPQSVVCLLSALQFHELTLELPSEVWLAFERGKSIPRLKNCRIRCVQMAAEVFRAGVDSHVIAGVPVRVTSVAKTIADCFKFRSSVTVTVAYEALKNAWAQRRVTSSDLVYFAKKDRVYNIMRPYLDTLS